MTKKKPSTQNLHFIPVFITSHPWTTIVLTLLISLGMTFGSVAFEFKYDSTLTNFVVRKGKTANQIEGMVMTVREECFFDSNTYEYLNQRHTQQTQPAAAISFYYECVDCDNLITSKQLDRIYQFEQTIKNNKDYSKYCLKDNDGVCSSQLSVLEFFYDSEGNQYSDLTEMASQLYYHNNGTSRKQYCDKSFNQQTLKSKFLSSRFIFGYPLKGYKNKDEQTNEQYELFKEYVVETIIPKAADSKKDNFEVLYLGSGITEAAISDLINHDALLIIFSIIMVFSYTLFHTKSLILTCLGILHILLALPMSYFFYTAILGVEWFTILNFLALFIVLGIGCDDIFIMLDAWKQSQHQNKEISKNIYTRMNWTYKRASVTMLITTITSAGAFFSNAASTIPPIRYFGVFTGMAIVFNFLLVITWFPAVIIIWNRYGENQCCFDSTRILKFINCKKKKLKKKEGKGEEAGNDGYVSDTNDIKLEDKSASTISSITSDSTRLPEKSKKAKKSNKLKKKSRKNNDIGEGLEKTSSSSGDYLKHSGSRKHKKTKKNSREIQKLGFDIEDLRLLERYFFRHHVHFLRKFRWGILIIFLAILIFFSIQTSKLEPSEEPTEFVPDGHLIKRGYNAELDEFYSSSIVGTVYLQWGVESIDRTGVDPLEIDNLGKVIYDNDWEPNLPSSQEWIIEVCDRIRNEYEGTVYREGQMICFMEDFRTWVTNETLSGGSYSFPVEEDQFQSLLGNFTNWVRKTILANEVQSSQSVLPYTFENTIAFDKASYQLQMYNIQFNLVIGAKDPAKISRPVFDHLEDFIEQLNKEAPSGMDMAGNVAWKWMEMLTEEILLSVAFNTVFLSMGIALMIILIATNNLITSLLAIISIGGIVVTIIGMMVSLGWQLGVIESVSLTIIVGISVDYIVHFCHAYNIADYDSSFDKLKVAITNLGISVVSAAITTLSASFVMFFTYIIFFKKFGIFIWMTIFSSVCWSFIFFFCLLVLLGPTGDNGNIKLFFQKIFCKKQLIRKSTITYKKNDDPKKHTNSSSTTSDNSSSTLDSRFGSEKKLQDLILDDNKYQDIEAIPSPKIKKKK
ncbi:sterol-sensing domain [Anaeramoeba flamelloides]|uniref:Sterol-sensing domain n=1 Tax=Anaeramoeba flamelloides TaxID=1746091 RepID=A0AAV7Z3Q1_9EUKA|nr:sterol-sensing domain [Anaeramoeba flamelloides]